MSLRVRPSQTTRTSQSHPITQDTVIELDQGGRLGLCYCPGKKVTRDGITHNRDLDADLQHLSSTWRVDTVVCLLNAAELRSLGLRAFEETIAKQGLKLLTFPIVEMACPASLNAAVLFLDEVAHLMRHGASVAMHCRGGVGRAGMMAACLLILLGLCQTPDQAIVEVRRCRCKQALETRRQEEFVALYAAAIKERMACDDHRSPSLVA